MPILKPTSKSGMSAISAKMPTHLKEDISEYCKFANISSLQEFLIQASEYILSRDKEWKKHIPTN